MWLPGGVVPLSVAERLKGGLNLLGDSR